MGEMNCEECFFRHKEWTPALFILSGKSLCQYHAEIERGSDG